jgi:hypothetical protein
VRLALRLKYAEAVAGIEPPQDDQKRLDIFNLTVQSGVPTAVATDALRHATFEGMSAGKSRRKADGESRRERSTEEWEPPADLRTTVVPPFPVEALPGWLRDYVRALSNFTQTPPDLAGMLALAVLSTAARGRYDIEVTPEYHEPLCLYVAVVLPPGERKSAVFAQMGRPLVAWEKVEHDKQAPSITAARTERDVTAQRIKTLKLEASKTRDPDERRNLTDEAASLERELAESAAAVLPRLLIDNATIEALVSALAEQDGRLALLSSEGGAFDIFAGVYSDGKTNLDPLLKAHDGEPVRVDRKGRPPEHIQRAILTVGLTLQPAVLDVMASHPRFRGRGLIGRILFALPTSFVGSRQVGVPPPSAVLTHEYDRHIRSMLDRATAADLSTIHCSGEALEAWRAFAVTLEPQLAPDTGGLADMADWAGKLAGTLARVAGLFHLAVGDPSTQVSGETMKAALSLAEYLIAHAKAVYATMGADPVVTDAQQALGWLERTGQATFTARDMFNGVRGHFKTMAPLQKALDLLEWHGYIRAVTSKKKGPGRPPSPRFEVNPSWRCQHQRPPQSSAESAEKAVEGGSADIARASRQRIAEKEQGRKRLEL